MKKLIFCSLIIVAALLGRLNAAPIFSTLGPGDIYDIGSAWTIGYGPAQFDQGDQFSFTGPNPYRLDSVELAVSLLYNGTNELDVWLMNDDGGKPGTIIEPFHFTGAMGSFGNNNPLLVGNSVLNPLLTPDTPYWLIASVTDDAAEAAWNLSSPGILGQHAYRFSAAGSWAVNSGTMGAFRINGTLNTNVIPAPGAILLGQHRRSFCRLAEKKKDTVKSNGV